MLNWNMIRLLSQGLEKNRGITCLRWLPGMFNRVEFGTWSYPNKQKTTSDWHPSQKAVSYSIQAWISEASNWVIKTAIWTVLLKADICMIRNYITRYILLWFYAWYWNIWFDYISIYHYSMLFQLFIPICNPKWKCTNN